MRASFAVPLLISLSLTSFGQAREARSVQYGRSNTNLVEARDVEAALDVLRRANYDFEDHVVKRSGSYSFNSGSDICFCKPEHHKHTSTKKPSSPHSSKPTVTSSSTTSTSSSSPPKYTGKGSCPSGYKYAGKGDTFIYNDNDLVDASNLDLTIDILGYPSPSSLSGSQSSTPAKGSPKCEYDHCCYKSSKSGSEHNGGQGSGSGGSESGSGPKATCPSGYTSYGKGNTIIKNDNDLIDLSDLTITLNILSFPSASSTPVSTSAPASDKPTCKDETCCVKQTTKKGSTIIKNDNDVVDASGATVKVCILSACV